MSNIDPSPADANADSNALLVSRQPPRTKAAPRSAPGTACSHCKRLKMRCDRTDSAPCHRCQKAKRLCTLPGMPTLRYEPTAPAIVPNHVQQMSNLGAEFNSQPQDLLLSLNQSSAANTSAQIPSFLSSPEPTSGDSGQFRGSDRSQSPRTLLGMQFKSPLSSISGNIDRPTRGKYDNGSQEQFLSHRDVCDLVAIFKTRLMMFIPILWEDDLLHLDDPSEAHSHLAYCICYVTARLVPGYRHIRAALSSTIEKIVNDGFIVDGEERHLITQFHSLAILYTLNEGSPLPWKSHPTEKHDMNFFKVKSATENLGAQIALHDSGKLSAEFVDGKPSVGLRKKLYRLWLFTMSHWVSIMTGIAPSIRPDSSIRQSCIILKQHLTDPGISRLVAEVEICLLWEKVEFHSHCLGEWWVSPALFDNPCSELRGFSDQINPLLENWRQDWCEQLRGPFANVLTLHFIFIKLCLQTYHFRSLIQSTTESPEQEELAIMQCVNSAAEVLTLLLSCGPLTTGQLQDAGSLVFVTLGFSCFFILHAKQYRPSLHLESELRLVRSAALFMISLATDVSESAHLCGTSVLQCLSGTSSVDAESSQTAVQEPPVYGTTDNNEHTLNFTSSSLENGLQGDGSDYMVNPSFDFTATLPEFFFNTVMYDNF